MKLATTIKLATKGYMPGDIKKISESGIEEDQIIALAESGYKPKDVDELIAFASEQETELQPGDDQKKMPASNEGNEGDPEGVDYKEELEKLQKSNAELNETLTRLQRENAQKDLGGSAVKSAEEQFQDALRNIY